MRFTGFAAVLATGLAGVLAAHATDVGGDQWGTWSLLYSPYRLIADVRVPPGQTLVIEPGVQIIGMGHYKITVDQGTLNAVGTADQPILMTANDQATGWRGLRLVQASDNSTIRHCIIEYAKGTGDYPGVRGGAVYCENCSPTISFNEMRFNYSHNGNYNGCGGGVLTQTSDALISHNYIHDNIADSGAGVCCTEYGTPIVADNLIVENTAYYAGGGIYAGARSSPLIERNLILHNTSGGWGGGGINSWTSFIYYGTFATIRDNVIAGNSATSGSEACGGGGLYCRYDRAIVTNNTIADNQALVGGGIYALNYPDQAPLVTNGIVWDNTAPSGAQIFLYAGSGSAITVRYTDIEGGWPGTGNLNTDPYFADPGNDDYHLTSLSGCIDSGDPGFVAQPGATDVDGQARVWDGLGLGTARVDMGADEFGSHAYGDMNCDGSVNSYDIDGFICALSPECEYESMYPDCDRILADCNGDGEVNAYDIDGFVALVGGG